MSKPTQEELRDSIKSLTNYRDRLRKEVISISQKLRMPSQQINSSIQNHSELKQIEKYIGKLTIQLNDLGQDEN